jgi:plastocyanin
MYIAEKVLLIAALSLVPQVAVQAQATVSGAVSLEERSGAERGDIRSAVVYLEPRDHVMMQVNDIPSMRSRVIAMRGREFVPHVTIVLAGGSVAFPNEDPFSHNVFSNVDIGPFDLGLYRRGATRAAMFQHAGVYPIYCNIHSMMVSFVVAVPSPWATQPDGTGHFTLHGVPAGRYVIHAWHEHGAREVTRDIVVPQSGIDAMQLAIDARTYVEGPHLNKFGRPYALIRDDRY